MINKIIPSFDENNCLKSLDNTSLKLTNLIKTPKVYDVVIKLWVPGQFKDQSILQLCLTFFP